MSDTLKTVLNGIPSFLWKDGEQPDATKFSNLFGSFSSAFNTISNIIGPAVNNGIAVSTFDTNVSAGKYYKDMSPSDRISFLSTLNTTILSTFNIARVLGPHAVLNPQYLPGSTHSKASTGSGYPLATGVKIQQLPFPPQAEYSWEIVDGDEGEWSLASSKENLLTRLEDKFFFLDEDGVLYSNQYFPSNSYIKYDLYVPNTYSYLGAGYNCIPDLSILSLSSGDRLCLELTYDSSSGAYSKWLVKLPEIISVRDPLLTSSTKEISSSGFEPVGQYSEFYEKKFYKLNENLYPTGGSPSVIEGNLLALYDHENQQTYIIDGWEVAVDEDPDVIRSYYLTGPKSLEQVFKNDSGGLLVSGGANTHSFFLFCLGNNISQQLAQVALNFSRHKHNGYDSYRISHKDLLDSENNAQGVGLKDGSDGGLNFISYNRQLALSNSPDNVHAQYMNRLGYLYGGSHGFYEAIASFDKMVDLNAMHGDLLFYPIENTSKDYAYPDETAYLAAVAGGSQSEEITWDLSGNPVTAVATDFPDFRTHAMIFGWPNPNSAEKYILGGTKLYYEPWNFLSDTEFDNKGQIWKLARHGFVPGDYTGLTGDAKRRGLNINWGNLFFGHREDIFGGLLTGNDKTEASAFFRTSEFNVVTTANFRSGTNTNSTIKNGYMYRDGFAVKALRGSNIWLSVGGENDATGALTLTDNPGSFAIDISLAGASSEGQEEPGGIRADRLYRDQSAGAGILATPSLRPDGKIPWVTSDNADQSIATLWDNSEIAPDTSDWYIKNSVLDIFNLAVDYQKDNSVNLDIAAGTDDSLLKWTAGRPFIRGTYGINFCISSNFNNLDTRFKTGYHLRFDETDPWGPGESILYTSVDEYVHREFKFWGSNEEIDPVANTVSLNNTVGGNINLLYNLGRDYRRFGLIKSWTSSGGSLSGGLDIYSPWANARAISLGTSTPENYGSAIRQASFVDAFAGLRNDPLQPYMAEYVLPFQAIYDLGKASDYSTNGVDIEELIKKVTFVIGQQAGATTGSMPPSLRVVEEVVHTDPGNIYDDSPYYAILPTTYGFNDIYLDGLIRGSEEILISNSDSTLPILGAWRFPASLVDFDIKLTYFIGASTVNPVGTGQGNSPHTTPHKYYKKVVDGDTVMIPAYAAYMTNISPEIKTKIPIIMTDRNNPGAIDDDYNKPSIVPYSAAIGLWPASTTASGYRGRFTLFQQRYGTAMNNKMFVALLNIHDRVDEDYNTNSPVPYQIYVEDTELKMRIVGSMNFKMMTSYHKTSIT